MRDETELRRVREGPGREERPGMTDDIIAKCPGNAESVLKKCREVLVVVLSQDPANWPADEKWPSLLPRWFVQASAPEKTREEGEDYLRWMQGLPYDEKLRVATAEDQHGRWSILSFLYWFGPDREWRWWDAKVETPAVLRVTLAVDGWPWGGGALRWLLRAAGATTAEKEI